MPLTTSQLLQNRYRIVRLIGEGGFGAVYRAWDTAVNQPIALKENLDVSQEAQRQFQREAAVMAGLRHPNLVRVTDHFLIPGQGQYLVMDFIEGQNLGQMMESQARPFTEAEVLPWIEQICDALNYLHTRDSPIIHRDIKPQNIIITPEGNAVLVDFGISKIYDPTLATTIGAKAVTPGFSPPEQYGSGATDARTDVYALGATLYALLTGQEPPDSVDLMIGNKKMPSPREIGGQVSMGMEQVILTAMSTTTDRRFQTITDLKAALQAPEQAAQAPYTKQTQGTLPAKRPFSLPKWAWGVLALLGVVLVVGIGFLFSKGSGERGGTVVTAPSNAAQSAPNKPSAMPIADDLKFMWEAGYKVTELAYADEQWSMILSQGAPYGNQTWQLKMALLPLIFRRSGRKDTA
ncbi:MAG: serine/threonine protein kinase [Chloroflexi bacterium]|nr:serine/threonine protein kinase [Chloroflexota bacterium]